MATKATDDPDMHPQRQRRAGTNVKDGEARLFCLAMERPEEGALRIARGGKGRRKIAGRSHCLSGSAVVRSPS
ncbi:MULTISPECIES: hypothetical protein [unclassified Mesorhizobium]|uniref:hypothetical protein n=1 Tax=unclassified Mesorhizobium TaxID=325217 RepID=UPI001093FAA5|nr:MULTISPECIES: hypothetical protein [unclassified Mesorhizobium]TGU86020.1 hypothetical protein EN794_053555 [Mesorhizobium sp. M00.F.Ca.ET.151.01.1.1]TGQ77361.1 hypothetical protein EN850_28890 [Mesorhizobium sp. M8A.F.Ca.ET.207.01.1.1]TGS39115.1 hypothetical protein EN825_28595 [Mesorhizobium sp. M8A.F.Ca.ET.182.01.1.1]TGS77396.1 hypothetical protein EN824_28830 [Mesorhizobium sp. M8A.F.Ca.ET.181.01.1.1]TGT36249.1 hypothetical protein EN808_28355 [Mesorhizobium sp. M8A.F.Ca.ET.165.01.1.1]